MTRATFLLAAIFTAGLAAAQDVQAQTTQSVWDGVYTDDQAARGAGQYKQHCAVCHGAVLEGDGEAPPLTGEFIPDWAGTTLADLFDKITVTMPLNAPNTLRPGVAADILAFILKQNNFPAGPRELDSNPDTLKVISFDVFKPKSVAKPAGKGKPRPGLTR